MSTFDHIKQAWTENQPPVSSTPTYNQDKLERLAKERVKKHTTSSMQYFWAAFTLQIIVYALLSHVIIKYGGDPETLLIGLAGILLYLPFTVILMQKFKPMAVLKPEASMEEGTTNLYQYIRRKHDLLQSFYSFKKRYELLLIPLSTGIGVFLIYKLFVPGGVEGNLAGAAITAAISLTGCVVAIYVENKKSFKVPLRELRGLLSEFETADELD